MAGSSILLTAGTKQHCHSCNSSKKEKRFFQIFDSCAWNWGWKFTEKSIELSTKAELLSFSYRSNLPSYSVIHKLTLNSWVFLKTSYLPVPQDSSLAGKLEISNFWGGVIAFWDLLDYGIAEKITRAEKDFLFDIPLKNIFELSSCQLHWDCSIMQCQVNLQPGACIFLETQIRHLVLQRSEVQNQK